MSYNTKSSERNRRDLRVFLESGDLGASRPRCVKAESLGPEGTMIGYKMKEKNI